MNNDFMLHLKKQNDVVYDDEDEVEVHEDDEDDEDEVNESHDNLDFLLPEHSDNQFVKNIKIKLQNILKTPVKKIVETINEKQAIEIETNPSRILLVLGSYIDRQLKTPSHTRQIQHKSRNEQDAELEDTFSLIQLNVLKYLAVKFLYVSITKHLLSVDYTKQFVGFEHLQLIRSLI